LVVAGFAVNISVSPSGSSSGPYTDSPSAALTMRRASPPPAGTSRIPSRPCDTNSRSPAHELPHGLSERARGVESPPVTETRRISLVRRDQYMIAFPDGENDGSDGSSSVPRIGTASRLSADFIRIWLLAA